MKVCRHRRRDDRHRIAAPTNRAEGPATDGRLPGASLFMSHGVGVLNMANNVCPRVPSKSGHCLKSRIAGLRPSAIR